ncbi:MAG: hypothetical protein V7638_2206 [Acidobacteriota bacterium]|jgi:hypothetical protein
MSQKLFVLSIALLLGLVAVSCRGMGTGDTEYSENEITREMLLKIGKTMQITFPESTHPLNVYNEISGPDDNLYLKAEIDPKDLDTLISKSPFATAEFRTDETRLQSSNRRKWWDPDRVKNFKSSWVRLADGNILTILVDLNNAQKPVVYLLWSEL